MTAMNKTEIHRLLEKIKSDCMEIQQVLDKHRKTTENDLYKEAIDQDTVTLNNLISITVSVGDDVGKERVNSSTELLLRIALNEFQKKVTLNPEKKKLQTEIFESLQEIRERILKILA